MEESKKLEAQPFNALVLRLSTDAQRLLPEAGGLLEFASDLVNYAHRKDTGSKGVLRIDGEC